MEEYMMRAVRSRHGERRTARHVWVDEVGHSVVMKDVGGPRAQPKRRGRPMVVVVGSEELSLFRRLARNTKSEPKVVLKYAKGAARPSG